MKIAALGLGAMGRRMARRLSHHGHDLALWSRSGVPRELEDLSARKTLVLADAVADAEAVLVSVTDDDASRAIWDAALPAMRRDALAIDASTLTPAAMRGNAERARAAHMRFVEAPVVGSRPQADAGTLVVLAGGERVDIERAEPIFSAFSSALNICGDAPLATVAKLAINALFASQVAVMGELLEAVESCGLDPSTWLEVAGSLPVVSPAAKTAGAAMLRGDFEPLFPVHLVVKDLRYALASGTGELPLIRAVRARFELAEQTGFGAENITAIRKIASTQPKGTT